jgi:hypothetical protein
MSQKGPREESVRSKLKLEAILIDARKQTVTKVEPRDFDHLKEMMGCELATVAVHDEGRNGETMDLLIDDEGLFKEGNLEGFIYEGYPQTLVGSGAIVQTYETDESADWGPITGMTIEDVKKKVTFSTMLESAKDNILSQPPMVKGFDSLEEMMAFKQDMRDQADDLAKAMFPNLKAKAERGASALSLFKTVANTDGTLKEFFGNHDPRFMFIQDSLFSETVSVMAGVLRPGSALRPMQQPERNASIATRLMNEEIESGASKPFFLGEPFPCMWIQSLGQPLALVTEGRMKSFIQAIMLWRSSEDGYLALLISPEGFVTSTVFFDQAGDPGYYARSVVHEFLFHLFRTLAKRGQIGTERINERFRVGTGAGRRQMRIKDIVHVRLKQKASSKVAASVHSGERELVEWSHRWEVMGHWRKVDGIGKDDRGRYHVQGYTWVIPHTKGPEEKEIVKKSRIVLDTKNEEEDGK